MVAIGLISLMLLPLVASFRRSPLICSRTRHHGRIRMQQSDEPVDFAKAVSSGDYVRAYEMIKSNPMQAISKDQARVLLNNMKVISKTAEPTDKKLLTPQNDASVLIYKRLERQKALNGFNCIEDDYPEGNGEVSVSRLEQVTGLNVSALTPKRRNTYWQLAGIGLCATEFFVGSSLGLDPLHTIIPGTFALFALDQLVYRGAYFETIYTTLVPEYKKKVICHEAGHFLIAYLLGLPVRECITNAMQARQYPELRGPAGTIFFDNKMADELAGNKITRRSLDRLSVVLMAGIAAEAVVFGVSEGGLADEQALIASLSSVAPPWTLPRIQGQARWAVMQAILLIKEHKDAFEALVKVLEAGQGVGDGVLAIEAHLPAQLPAERRRRERQLARKRQQQDNLLRYVQRMIWKVGGLETSELSEGALSPSPSSSSSPQESVEVFRRTMEALEQRAVQRTHTPFEQHDPVNDGPSGVEEELQIPVPDVSHVPSAVSATKRLLARELLQTHRSFQMKLLEAEEQRLGSQIEEIAARLQGSQAKHAVAV